MRADSGKAIVYLIIHSLAGDLKEDERVLLNDWLKDSQNRFFYEKMSRSEYIRKKMSSLDYSDKGLARERLERNIRMRLRKRRIKSGLNIAAIVLLFLSVGGGIWFSLKNVVSMREEPIGGTLGGTSPVLRLASGEEICLQIDSVYRWEEGLLEEKGEYVIYKEPIENNKDAEKKLKFHEIRVPKGAEYRMVLSDGTKVYLNAESMLRFPVKFAEGERRVVCDGEVFFEVSKDTLRPFFVESAGNVIKVLGTSFIVRNYEGEPYRTVLLSGSIRLRGNDKIVLLNPGEQAQLSGGRWIVGKADPSAVSWLNGYFLFENRSLGYIMKELSRWYNIEVFYADSRKQDEHYSFEIERSSTLKQVMEILRKTRTLDVEINDRVVIIR